jgi:hypothetical protein
MTEKLTERDVQEHLKRLGWRFVPTGPNEWEWIKFDDLGRPEASQGSAIWAADLKRVQDPPSEPRWTVHYNINCGDWVGTGWEFFNSDDEAQDCYEAVQRNGDVPTKRPYHRATDEKHLGAIHRQGASDDLSQLQ